MDKALLKGCNDTMILYKDVIMIANVRNKTIITALEQSNSDNEILTNIDSAILIK